MRSKFTYRLALMCRLLMKSPVEAMQTTRATCNEQMFVRVTHGGQVHHSKRQFVECISHYAQWEYTQQQQQQ